MTVISSELNKLFVSLNYTGIHDISIQLNESVGDERSQEE